jgi:hypothetical protein
MGAEAHDVYLSHGGAQISQKTGGEQEGGGLKQRVWLRFWLSSF